MPAVVAPQQTAFCETFVAAVKSPFDAAFESPIWTAQLETKLSAFEQTHGPTQHTAKCTAKSTAQFQTHNAPIVQTHLAAHVTPDAAAERQAQFAAHCSSQHSAELSANEAAVWSSLDAAIRSSHPAAEQQTLRSTQLTPQLATVVASHIAAFCSAF